MKIQYMLTQDTPDNKIVSFYDTFERRYSYCSADIVTDVALYEWCGRPVTREQFIRTTYTEFAIVDDETGEVLKTNRVEEVLLK